MTDLCSCGRELDRVLHFGEVAIPMPLCSSCGDEQAASDEREREARRRVDLLARAGGGIRLAGFSFATYPSDPAGTKTLQIAHDWLDKYLLGERFSLYLHGAVGTGKTGLAWSIVRELIEKHGVEGMIVNWRDLLDERKLSFDDSTATPTTYLRARRVPVLALDDVGAERATEWALEELAILVDARYGRSLPTILTSNYAASELAGKYGVADPTIGQRIVSRLMDGTAQVRFTGRDRRQAA